MVLLKFFKISKAITIVVCIVLAVNWVMLFRVNSSPRIVREKATVSEPYFLVDDSMQVGAISDFAICGDYLYILLSKDIMKCYSLDGVYKHSYMFHMGEKGKAHLYVKDNTLFLESRKHYFYRFKDGKFVDMFSLDASEYYPLTEELSNDSNKYQSNSGGYFELRGTSIWRVDSASQIEIVHRPSWLVIFQGNIQMYIHFVCLVIIIALNFRRIKH